MIRVGLLKIDIHLPESGSLKEKRVVLRSIKDKIRNNFNVSISESDNHDKWQLATFGIACVANDKRYLDGVLNKVKNFFERNRHIVVIDCQLEIL